MNEETLKRLDALGEKLGVVGERLWEVAVRRGFIEGVISIPFELAWLVLMWMCWKRLSAWDPGQFDMMEKGVAYTCVIVGIFIGLAMLNGSLVNVLNPEGYALALILGKTK